MGAIQTVLAGALLVLLPSSPISDLLSRQSVGAKRPVIVGVSYVGESSEMSIEACAVLNELIHLESLELLGSVWYVQRKVGSIQGGYILHRPAPT